MEGIAELIARARLICGEQHVITHPTVLSTYRSDGVRRSGPPPPAAILPGSVSELAGVVSACAATGTPYAVRGAGTSRAGGALAGADRVLIVLTRMRRIAPADGDELTVEAGAPVAAVLRRDGRRWLADAEPLGTVGGHVAERRSVVNLRALELVRPDGTLVRLDSRRPGYDLIGAFPGSRGHAGIAATLTLRAVAR